MSEPTDDLRARVNGELQASLEVARKYRALARVVEQARRGALRTDAYQSAMETEEAVLDAMSAARARTLQVFGTAGWDEPERPNAAAPPSIGFAVSVVDACPECGFKAETGHRPGCSQAGNPFPIGVAIVAPEEPPPLTDEELAEIERVARVILAPDFEEHAVRANRGRWTSLRSWRCASWPRSAASAQTPGWSAQRRTRLTIGTVNASTV